jgi:flavodoxin
VNPRRVLVVFYSRSGNTRRVGLDIAARLDADVEELLDDAHRRRGLLGFLRAGYDALRKRPATIRPTRTDPAAYDLVIIGTPVWSDSVTPAVRAYLEARRAALPRVAFFLTHGGSGRRRVLDQMETLAGKRPLATAAVREGQLGHAEGEAIVARFVGDLAPAAPRSRAA